MRPFAVAVTLLAALPCRAAPAASPDVGALVQPAIDAEALHAAVIGTVDSQGHTRVVGFGHARAGGAAPDGKTLFEIGSATKLFTALVLADLVVARRVTLDEPVAKLLPPSVKLPSKEGRAITLVDLATHTSGLPRLPANLLPPPDPTQPYARYDAAQLYEFLAGATLATTPGAHYEYSNLGAGLLGHALALAEKTSYDELVRRHVTAPLGLRDTHVTPLAGDEKRLADGHDADGNVVAPWRFDVLAPAGAIRSTMDDMLVFARAQLGDAPPSAKGLAPAIALSHEPRHDLPPELGANARIALGWHLRDDNRTVWHNGQTAGCHSYVAFDPVAHVAVVVLAADGTGLVDEIGYSILRQLARQPAPPSPTAHLAKPIALAPAVLDGLVGNYQLAPLFFLGIRRDGDHLVAQATAQPAFRLYATSPRHFFLRVVAATIDFGKDASGATELVLHQNGRDVVGKRIVGAK